MVWSLRSASRLARRALEFLGYVLMEHILHHRHMGVSYTLTEYDQTFPTAGIAVSVEQRTVTGEKLIRSVTSDLPTPAQMEFAGSTTPPRLSGANCYSSCYRQLEQPAAMTLPAHRSA
jgi:hypothetical protein